MNCNRINRSLACAALAMTIATGIAEAREFRVSSFEPAQGFYSAQILQAWIDEVNPKLSEGNAFKLYPGSILGAPPAQAELVKKGVADVALVVPTYTPGLFPMSSVVEIPAMAPTSAKGTAILNALADEGALEAEYADYKVIAVFTTPGYRIFLSGDGAESPADLEGLKLRTPSPFGSKLFGMMGASGVSIPAPQVYENLERNVVSGAAWVMDAYKTFRLDEVAPSITDIRFTASPMAILMNKAAYESLPEEDRAVIDSMSGRTAAEWVASIVDTKDAEIEKAFREKGNVTFIDLDDAQREKWNEALAGAPALWAEENAGGEAVLKRATEIAAGD
jgi:TRAP-type transport system periplasmic protein